MLKEEKEEIKQIVICLGIQLRKQQKSLDGLDNNLTDSMREQDAMMFDLRHLENRFGITEEDYKKELL